MKKNIINPLLLFLFPLSLILQNRLYAERITNLPKFDYFKTLKKLDLSKKQEIYHITCPPVEKEFWKSERFNRLTGDVYRKGGRVGEPWIFDMYSSYLNELEIGGSSFVEYERLDMFKNIYVSLKNKEVYFFNPKDKSLYKINRKNYSSDFLKTVPEEPESTQVRINHSADILGKKIENGLVKIQFKEYFSFKGDDFKWKNLDPKTQYPIMGIPESISVTLIENIYDLKNKTAYRKRSILIKDPKQLNDVYKYLKARNGQHSFGDGNTKLNFYHLINPYNSTQEVPGPVYPFIGLEDAIKGKKSKTVKCNISKIKILPLPFNANPKGFANYLNNQHKEGISKIKFSGFSNCSVFGGIELSEWGSYNRRKYYCDKGFVQIENPLGREICQLTDVNFYQDNKEIEYEKSRCVFR